MSTESFQDSASAAWAHVGAWGVISYQVIVLEEHLPPSLSARQALWLFEVGKVLVVG